MNAHEKQTLNYDKIEKGDYILTLSWAKVISKRGYGPELQCVDLDDDTDFRIQGARLIDACYSASAVLNTATATKTELAELLVSSRNVPFTVAFKKSDGKMRELVGRLVKPEPLLGRSHVEDLERPAGKRLRLVDHRTIQWMIVNGTKYTLKGGK